MIVRIATPDDTAAIASFARWTYEKAFGDSFAPSDLLHHLTYRLSDSYFRAAQAHDAFLLAEEEGRLTGYVQFGQGDEPHASADDRQLVRLYVHPDRLGSGIGTMLMKAALAHESMAAAPAIWLDVWERNEGARRLYERFGFAVARRQKFVPASGVALGDDLIMVRFRAHKL